MKKLPVISDALLAAVCAFLLFFTLTRYYISAAAGLAAGICAGLAAGVAAFLYIGKRHRLNYDKTTVKADAEKLAAHLAILPKEQSAELFEKSLSGAKETEDGLETEDSVYFLCFKFEPATRDDMLPAARSKSQKTKYFVCCTADGKCAAFAAAAKITILDADDVYSMLKEHDALPEKYIPAVEGKSKFFARIRAKFSRRLCLPCFWSGTALLFFSYFTYFPIYYIVSGSLLLALCAAAAIFGKRRGT